MCWLGLILQNLAGASAGPFPVRCVAGAFTLTGSGFARNAVYPTTTAQDAPETIARYGSWLGGDTAKGTVVTTWLAPVDHFFIMVAGYPASAHMLLAVDVVYSNGASRSFVLTADDPHETWRRLDFALPSAGQVEKFRIRAMDGSAAVNGWLGFSQPFIWPSGIEILGVPGSLLAALGVVCALATAVACFPRDHALDAPDA